MWYQKSRENLDRALDLYVQIHEEGAPEHLRFRTHNLVVECLMNMFDTMDLEREIRGS